MAEVFTKESIIDLVRPNLSKNARTVLEKRYLRKDNESKTVESPEDMFWRVAENIAQADRNYDPAAETDRTAAEFYGLMASLDFLPNSPTLMNAGRELQQLSACFVLPIEDSMDSIFDTLKATALIHKSGGGTGFSFSRLRPKSDVVCSTRGISSGPISFMQVFNAATEAIKQGGTRRGANMGILRVDHPDILDFVTAKEDTHALTNFNISVALTDVFMQALMVNGEYELINPRSGKPVQKLRASEVFNKIVLQAWKNGEPGIVFIDRINRDNPTPQLGDIESTNPCGEQPLLPFESCNLGSINLAQMWKSAQGKTELDWERLEKTIRKSVHFLDNVIDMNRYTLPKIAEMTKGNRKIGLGVMGWADLLARMEIPYDSDKAQELGTKLISFVREKAEETSQILAEKRGSFPNYPLSIFSNGKPRRNATLTTIAPTGTIGIIASVTGGIEPFFALAYHRTNVLDNDQLPEVNSYLEEFLKKQGLHSPDLISEIAETGSLQQINALPESIKKIFLTAHDISPENHIRMQAVFQEHTDNAVSKTINFPNSATEEDVRKAYLLAYKLGCKGVTVYRDGSRQTQVLNRGLSSKQSATTKERRPRLRPNVTQGVTIKMRTGCGNMYVTINEDIEGPCEVFTQLGKSGGCTASQAEAVSRLVSLVFRSGIQPSEVIDQIKGIRCPSPALAEGGAVLSCADAIAKALEIYVREKSVPDLFSATKKKTGRRDFIGTCPECPECGGILEFGEGCMVCRTCGYSRCW